MSAASPLAAVEEMLLARFSEFDRDEQGFIAADRLRELLSSLGDEFGELPSEDELRKQALSRARCWAAPSHSVVACTRSMFPMRDIGRADA